jgi:hypothetical protein
MEDVPRSSAALDAALAAGVDMLRQQAPKVEASVAAGLAASRRFMRKNAPLVRSVASQAAAQATEVGGRAVSALVDARVAGSRVASDVVVRTAPGFSRIVAWLRARGRRDVIAAAGALAIGIVSYYGLHFAIMHRSRCPAASVAEPPVGDSAHAGSPKAHEFTVLVDAPGTRRAGSNLDVYYDVCGMPNGPFKTRVSVVKESSGLQRLLGGSVAPVVAIWDDDATRRAIRRHRTVDFREMPAGTYALSVVVTDAKGRKRESDSEFEVVGR